MTSGTLLSRGALLFSLGLLMQGWFACNFEERFYFVELKGTLKPPPGKTESSGKLHIKLYFASTGKGILAHPLGIPIKTFTSEKGNTFTHDFEYPIEQGKGLVVYAWRDLDGDGLLCAPGKAKEYAGITEVKDFPKHKVSVQIVLRTPCAGAEALYPE